VRSDRAALVAGLDGLTETRAMWLQKVVDGINVISEGNQQSIHVWSGVSTIRNPTGRLYSWNTLAT